MEKITFEEYVIEECRRQWKDNQEEEYGPWHKQELTVRAEYYQQMYDHLYDRLLNDPILQREFDLCCDDENDQATQEISIVFNL